jgi:poly-gamma-glutamate synthesis protein (capsule biosynthesis protein)
MHFFMRLRARNHERLVPVEALDGALKQAVAARLETIFSASGK